MIKDNDDSYDSRFLMLQSYDFGTVLRSGIRTAHDSNCFATSPTAYSTQKIESLLSSPPLCCCPRKFLRTPPSRADPYLVAFLLLAMLDVSLDEFAAQVRIMFCDEIWGGRLNAEVLGLDEGRRPQRQRRELAEEFNKLGPNLEGEPRVAEKQILKPQKGGSNTEEVDSFCITTPEDPKEGGVGEFRKHISSHVPCSSAAEKKTSPPGALKKRRATTRPEQSISGRQDDHMTLCLQKKKTLISSPT